MAVSSVEHKTRYFDKCLSAFNGGKCCLATSVFQNIFCAQKKVKQVCNDKNVKKMMTELNYSFNNIFCDFYSHKALMSKHDWPHIIILVAATT